MEAGYLFFFFLEVVQDLCLSVLNRPRPSIWRPGYSGYSGYSGRSRLFRPAGPDCPDFFFFFFYINNAYPPLDRYDAQAVQTSVQAIQTVQAIF